MRHGRLRRCVGLRERMNAMIVERSMHPQFLSNTYLVADGAGGPAFFVDAGGPVEPLHRDGGAARAAAHARAADPPPLTTTSASSATLRAALAGRCRCSIHPLERDLRRRHATGTDAGRRDAAARHARGAAAGHAGAHRGDAVVPGRASPGAPATRRRPRRGAAAGSPAAAVVFTGDTLFTGLGRRRARARATPPTRTCATRSWAR